MTFTSSRALVLQFNAGVKRSREDYYAHPTRACVVRDCTNLHGDDDGFCKTHRRDRRGAAARMRQAPARKGKR